ncbi:hypothetical protein D7V97_08510 [Corallococcus sp. CA053C]|nr:hypothetical protein D7V97_08510 [Corallococcus sp. CA053C]
MRGWPRRAGPSRPRGVETQAARAKRAKPPMIASQPIQSSGGTKVSMSKPCARRYSLTLACTTTALVFSASRNISAPRVLLSSMDTDSKSVSIRPSRLPPTTADSFILAAETTPTRLHTT